MANEHEQGARPPQGPPDEPAPPADPPQGHPLPGGHPSQGDPPPQGYPPYGYAPPEPPNNTLALVSLVSGIAGFFMGLPAPVAIVTGHIARRQIRDAGGREGGEGMATAGLVLGYLGVAFWIVMVALLVLFWAWFMEEGVEWFERIKDAVSPSPSPV